MTQFSLLIGWLLSLPDLWLADTPVADHDVGVWSGTNPCTLQLIELLIWVQNIFWSEGRYVTSKDKVVIMDVWFDIKYLNRGYSTWKIPDLHIVHWSSCTLFWIWLLNNNQYVQFAVYRQIMECIHQVRAMYTSSDGPCSYGHINKSRSIILFTSQVTAISMQLYVCCN